MGGRLAHPARPLAITGHALADLASRTGDDNDHSEAVDRLSKAADQFDTETTRTVHPLRPA